MDRKDDNYNKISIIIDNLIKIIYYKLVKTILDITSFAKVIIDKVVRYYNFLKWIIND